MKTRRARSFAEFILSGQSEILRCAQDDSEGLRMTAGKRFSAACLGRNLLNLKPSLRTIPLRLAEPLIARLKVLANQRDVPYQALLKVLLAERLKQEEAKQARTLRPAQSLP